MDAGWVTSVMAGVLGLVLIGRDWRAAGRIGAANAALAEAQAVTIRRIGAAHAEAAEIQAQAIRWLLDQAQSERLDPTVLLLALLGPDGGRSLPPGAAPPP